MILGGPTMRRKKMNSDKELCNVIRRALESQVGNLRFKNMPQGETPYSTYRTEKMKSPLP